MENDYSVCSISIYHRRIFKVRRAQNPENDLDLAQQLYDSHLIIKVSKKTKHRL